MQLGEGKAAFIKDVVSVYRRSDVGVWMNTSIDEHFLKTRLDYLGWLEGMLSYYAENKCKFYPKIPDAVPYNQIVFAAYAHRSSNRPLHRKQYMDWWHAGRGRLDSAALPYFFPE